MIESKPYRLASTFAPKRNPPPTIASYSGLGSSIRCTSLVLLPPQLDPFVGPEVLLHIKRPSPTPPEIVDEGRRWRDGMVPAEIVTLGPSFTKEYQAAYLITMKQYQGVVQAHDALLVPSQLLFDLRRRAVLHLFSSIEQVLFFPNADHVVRRDGQQSQIIRPKIKEDSKRQNATLDKTFTFA